MQVDILPAEKVSLEQEKTALMNKIPQNPNNKVVMNPYKTLLIGSSILRNVESKNKENLPMTVYMEISMLMFNKKSKPPLEPFRN